MKSQSMKVHFKFNIKSDTIKLITRKQEAKTVLRILCLTDSGFFDRAAAPQQ